MKVVFSGERLSQKKKNFPENIAEYHGLIYITIEVSISL